MRRSDMDGIKIRLQHQRDKFELTLPRGSRLPCLMREAERLTGVEASRQRLICRGKVLTDSSLALDSLPPKAGAEISVMMLAKESKGSQA
eukprot:CAMPEP_0181508656 /NCGR_PEP_ID=MMETSP1110-20121109/59878_1 /TAXON_ID=174948 /ORGANISM="Symbiodinium sp., Strain CCMP421" /LENGTH=89 /DNA_ID=CAMNT_0023638063 /DNA_START=1 /DNA_END=267 /DNA_ORIENTATION=+